MRKLYNKAYNIGCKALAEKNYSRARHFLMEATKDFHFREKAILQLIRTELENGFFDAARKLLDDNSDLISGNYHIFYSDLERFEYNYSASIKHSQEAMSDFNIRDKAVLKSARAYIDAAMYDKGIPMLEDLKDSYESALNASFDLVYLYIYQGDYEKAYTEFKTIRYDLVQKEKKGIHYQILGFYLNYLLGITKEIPSSLSPKMHYIAHRIVKDDKNALLRHINAHKKANRANSRFYVELDLNAFLDEIQERIENLNPSHDHIVDTYQLILDRPIGIIGGHKTNSVTVNTFTGTKKILTAYPVSLSKEFNKEGNLESPELFQKRQSFRI